MDRHDEAAHVGPFVGKGAGIAGHEVYRGACDGGVHLNERLAGRAALATERVAVAAAQVAPVRGEERHLGGLKRPIALGQGLLVEEAVRRELIDHGSFISAHLGENRMVGRIRQRARRSGFVHARHQLTERCIEDRTRLIA